MNQTHVEQTAKVDRATETDNSQTKTKPTPKFRLAVWFSVHGDLRYLSHHDTMELWRKLLVRARLPLRFTQGFNPRLRITLPLPRSVAMAAENELLLVILEHQMPIGQILDQIRPQCPAELTVNHARYVCTKTPATALWAQYNIALTPNVDPVKIQQAIQNLTQAELCPIERSAHGRHRKRTIELKKYIAEIELQTRNNQNNICCKINIGAQATPRIGEIQNALGIESASCVQQITRLATGYPEPLQLHQLNETK